MVPLLLYLPTLTGSPNSIDDFKMLMDMELRDSINLPHLFLPGTSLYYRPLLMLTFWLDKMVWRLAPSFMLLENILLHTGSVILVFLIGRRLFEKRSLAALAALLFAVHPLATESLNWISGRTDPMATFFHLVAALCLLVGEGQALPMAGAILASLAGILSKEMSAIFVPVNGLLFLLVAGPASQWRQRLRTTLFFGAPFVLAGVLALAYRHFHFAGGAALPHLLAGGSLGGTLFRAIAIFGFYIKKLFLPAPLNFAIASISPSYVWVGIATLIFLAWECRRHELWIHLFLLAAILTFPAILLGLARVAWTPYAERYVYQAVPFFALALAGLIGHIHDSTPSRAPVITAACLLVIAGAVTLTVRRNILWQDKIAFFQDTTSQSPSFATVRNELAVALFRRGENQKAISQLKTGIALDKKQPAPRNQILYANLAMYQLQKNRLKTAEDTLAPVLAKGKKQASYEVLATHAEIVEKKLRQTTPDKEKLQKDLLSTYQLLAQKQGNPFYYYLAGKTAVTMGDLENAAELFTKAYRAAPVTAEYRQASAILAKKYKGRS